MFVNCFLRGEEKRQVCCWIGFSEEKKRGKCVGELVSQRRTSVRGLNTFFISRWRLQVKKWSPHNPLNRVEGKKLLKSPKLNNHRIKIRLLVVKLILSIYWDQVSKTFFFDKLSKIGYSENAAWFFYNRDSCRWMSFRRGFSSTNEQNFCWRVTWTILSCQSNQSFRK